MSMRMSMMMRLGSRSVSTRTGGMLARRCGVGHMSISTVTRTTTTTTTTPTSIRLRSFTSTAHAATAVKHQEQQQVLLQPWRFFKGQQSPKSTPFLILLAAGAAASAAVAATTATTIAMTWQDTITTTSMEESTNTKELDLYSSRDDVSVWVYTKAKDDDKKKDNKTDHSPKRLILVGAINYAKLSCDLIQSIIRQEKPSIIFLDINETVFTTFQIQSRVEANEQQQQQQQQKEGNNENRSSSSSSSSNTIPTSITSNPLWKNLVIMPEIIPKDNLQDVASLAKTKFSSKNDDTNSDAGGFMSSFLTDPVEKSIRSVFGQLRFAGVPISSSSSSTEDSPNVPTWTHYVTALQEGLDLMKMNQDKTTATTTTPLLVLGGRDDETNQYRSQTAMTLTSRTSAAKLATMIGPTWQSSTEKTTPKQNFMAIRNLMKTHIPLLEYIMMTELDIHTAHAITNVINVMAPAITTATTTTTMTTKKKNSIWSSRSSNHTKQKHEQSETDQNCTVAVVMLLHMDGIEQELKSLGWEQVVYSST